MSKYDSLLDKWEKRDPVAPRPSCEARLKYSRQLQHIMPGYSGVVNDVYVTRTTVWHECTYWINDVELSLDQTLDVVMGRKQAPAPKAEIFQFDLRLETEGAKPKALRPRKQKQAAKSKKKTIPVSKAQMKLPLMEAA